MRKNALILMKKPNINNMPKRPSNHFNHSQFKGISKSGANNVGSNKGEITSGNKPMLDNNSMLPVVSLKIKQLHWILGIIFVVIFNGLVKKIQRIPKSIAEVTMLTLKRLRCLKIKGAG